MIPFERYKLENGLTVLLHEDNSSPLVAVNVLYDVGSRDEDPEMTGFAHLFEHLMFGGSINVPDFDLPIQKAGGENNAFTNADMTNFYDLVPAENLETALWLESDRMLQLAFSEKMLSVQKKVVVEEFKETCLNVPYGDTWHELSKLCYQSHPYKWPTIGKDFSHIENAELKDVENFFNKFYNPSNAILCLTGNFETTKTKEAIQKWFGPIPYGTTSNRSLKKEPVQSGKRQKIKKADVPEQSITLAFHMVDRLHKDYYAFDMISDILGSGKSSRLYSNVVRKGICFSNLSAYISGSVDPGLFIVDGKIKPGGNYEEGLKIIWEQLNGLKEHLISERELTKIKNKIISSIEYSDLSILNKAINLCYYELIGDADMINKQKAFYEAITAEDIQRIAKECFIASNSNEVIYIPNELSQAIG